MTKLTTQILIVIGYMLCLYSLTADNATLGRFSELMPQVTPVGYGVKNCKIIECSVYGPHPRCSVDDGNDCNEVNEICLTYELNTYPEECEPFLNSSASPCTTSPPQSPPPNIPGNLCPYYDIECTKVQECACTIDLDFNDRCVPWRQVSSGIVTSSGLESSCNRKVLGVRWMDCPGLSRSDASRKSYEVESDYWGVFGWID